MKQVIDKRISTKNGILIIVAATLMIIGGILLTNIDLIFGAGTGDADTLDSMDWEGDDCSGVDCNIKDYIDAKSAPCADNDGGQCYVSQATKSALDTDLTASNIKSGVNIFGVAGTARIRCRAGKAGYCWTDYCVIGTDCTKECAYDGNTKWEIRTYSSTVGVACRFYSYGTWRGCSADDDQCEIF